MALGNFLFEILNLLIRNELHQLGSDLIFGKVVGEINIWFIEKVLIVLVCFFLLVTRAARGF